MVTNAMVPPDFLVKDAVVSFMFVEVSDEVLMGVYD